MGIKILDIHPTSPRKKGKEKIKVSKKKKKTKDGDQGWGLNGLNGHQLGLLEFNFHIHQCAHLPLFFLLDFIPCIFQKLFQYFHIHCRILLLFFRLKDKILGHLRTVPTIVTAHTFCATPDTRIAYRQCLLTQGYFCAI